MPRLACSLELWDSEEDIFSIETKTGSARHFLKFCRERKFLERESLGVSMEDEWEKVKWTVVFIELVLLVKRRRLG